VLGLAMQVKKSGNDEEKTRLIRIWAVGAITPFERSLVWVQNGAGGLWHNYFYLRGVRAENRQLKEQIEHMRLEQVRLAEDAAQARRLQTLLAFKEQFISRTVAAQVIGSSGSDHSRIIYIDKGENSGIRRDMAVMNADGIVGKVLLVYPSVAQVLLINDESSGVGALIEDGRVQGVLHGTANGEIMLEKVMADEHVPIGDAVLTSGGDQIFPKGLPVGTVTKVGNGKDLFLNIKIKPAADLSKLEEVLVLVEKQERQATAEDSGRMRAADILAQRLPSVPDKPTTGANLVTPGNGGTSSTATPSKTEVKQPNGGVSKPQGLTSPAKPAATGSNGVAGSPASSPAKTVKTASGTSSVHNPSSTEPSLKPTDSPSAVQPSAIPKKAVPRKTDVAGGPGIAVEPASSPSTTPSAQPPATQSTPPQTSPQPPAEENKPQ
jgi:rod shape-determining protein MreC